MKTAPYLLQRALRPSCRLGSCLRAHLEYGKKQRAILQGLDNGKGRS